MSGHGAPCPYGWVDFVGATGWSPNGAVPDDGEETFQTQGETGMKRLMMFIMMLVVLVGAGLAPVEAAPYPEPLIQDSEFIPRYDDNGNALVNYRLVQFAAELASQVYGDGKYEVPADGNSNYELNLKIQSSTLLKNGFKQSDIMLVNNFDDPAVKTLRQLDEASLKEYLYRSASDRVVPVDDTVLTLLAKASVQGVIATKQILFNGVKRNLWVVVFRGTQGFSKDGIIDWAINVTSGEKTFNPTPDNIKTHRGFIASVQAFESSKAGKEDYTVAQKIILNSSTNDIFLVIGHSLGGANATLFGSKLISGSYYGIPRDNLQLITFGAPSVGNDDFRNVFNGEQSQALKVNLQRIRHKYDLVPYSSYLSSVADDAVDFAENIVTGDPPNKAFIAVATERVIANWQEKFPFVHIGTPHAFGDIASAPYVQEFTGTVDERFEGYNPNDWMKIAVDLSQGLPNHSMHKYEYLAYAGALAQATSDITAPTITASPSWNNTYTDPPTVTLQSNDPSARIIYTTDGSDPTETGGTTYTVPFQLTETSTVKAVAVDAAGNTSKVGIFPYTVHYLHANGPYLQIIVPNRTKAAFNAQDDSFYADPGDVIRLKVANASPSPIAALAGQTIKVIVFMPDGSDKSVNGTLSGDEISFTIATTADGTTMPAGRYRIFAFMGIDGSGDKHPVPPYTLVQLQEKDSLSGGTNPPPSTTGSVVLPRTGQYKCYNASGSEISCAGTGQDGSIQAGKPLPIPRFTDNSNGTVTDNLTGLVWLKDANCFGGKTWYNAPATANSLSSGVCGLTDGSTAGQWRLPNIVELESLVDAGRSYTVISTGHPFSAVQADFYWSSSTDASYIFAAWVVDMFDGTVSSINKSYSNYYVWPVRDN